MQEHECRHQWNISVAHTASKRQIYVIKSPLLTIPPAYIQRQSKLPFPQPPILNDTMKWNIALK